MRKNASVFWKVGVCLSLALALTYCGRSMPVASNSSITNDQANTALTERLVKTDEITTLGGVRDLLRPIETVLNEISNALNADVKVDGSPVVTLGKILAELRRVLK
ncbi:hypothetical protein WDW86_22530 [Bdellovibrionota bacterium FG-2]